MNKKAIGIVISAALIITSLTALSVFATDNNNSASAGRVPSLTTCLNVDFGEPSPALLNKVSYPDNPVTTVGDCEDPGISAFATDINETFSVGIGRSKTYTAKLTGTSLPHDQLSVKFKSVTTTSGEARFTVTVTDTNGDILCQETATGSFSRTWGPLVDGPYTIMIVNDSLGTLKGETNISTSRK